ncbi:MAG: DUF4892 domain-containing protein [Rhodocyclaceae bacterium]
MQQDHRQSLRGLRFEAVVSRAHRKARAMLGLLGALGLAGALAFAPGAHAQGDVAGAQDHPLLSRFTGAVITAHAASDYDLARLPAAPIARQSEPEGVLELEGRVTHLAYRIPHDKSVLEVVRNYEAALAAGGFETLFSCRGRDCGRGFDAYVILSGEVFPSGFSHATFNDGSYALLARRADDERVAHVFLHFMDDSANKRTLVRQLVVEGEPMATGQVTVRSAEALAATLEADGKVVVDGIFFDSDSATLRPESAEALAQMAQLLANAPGLTVFIVGHTDNQGSFEHNRQLSQRRAEAVAQALARDHGIDATRLGAHGVASLAPVASNAGDAGRARNRRVELVLK